MATMTMMDDPISTNSIPSPPGTPSSHATKDRWFYPEELKNDLAGVDLPDDLKAETLVCAWEYTRCVIPQWTNWKRYIAFVRIVVMQAICEFRGDWVRPEHTDEILGYNLQSLIDTLFAGSPVHSEMAHELRAFFVGVSEKSSSTKNGSELYRRYVNALARSPKDYFRLRDSDGTGRFTIAAAWACNDVDMSQHWFTDAQWQILIEIGLGLYDSVAFFKHRAEGEIHNFFGYAGEEMRLETTRLYREVLWALDAAWAQKQENTHVINFLRPFGGPVHMMMRRYRFIDEGLTIGSPENARVVEQTRQNFKLWYRVENNTSAPQTERYNLVLARKDDLLFEGLAECLESAGDVQCSDCRYRNTYGAEDIHQFGGVQLCAKCRQSWAAYVRSLPYRAAEVFPELRSVENYWK